MEIKILNEKTIKLSLTSKDMKKYNITHEILKNKKTTKELSSNLLQKINETISIDASKNQIFLESFKTKEKGCILYLNISTTSEQKILKLPKKEETKTTIAIAQFKTAKSIKQYCKNINLLKKIKFESELYSSENKFILIIFIPTNEKKELCALTKEFSLTYEESSRKYCIIKEHYKKIFEKNAIEKIIKTKF